MRPHFSADTLRHLRNNIPIHRLIGDVLGIPCKVREGYFRFLCPHCSDFNTATLEISLERSRLPHLGHALDGGSE